MARIDLPSGGWAELRDASSVRVRDRKKVLLTAEKKSAEGAGELAGLISTAELVMALAVDGWSYELALPRDDIAVLDDLQIPDYDEIATNLVDFRKALFPDFQAATSDPKEISTP